VGWVEFVKKEAAIRSGRVGWAREGSGSRNSRGVCVLEEGGRRGGRRGRGYERSPDGVQGWMSERMRRRVKEVLSRAKGQTLFAVSAEHRGA